MSDCLRSARVKVVISWFAFLTLSVGGARAQDSFVPGDAPDPSVPAGNPADSAHGGPIAMAAMQSVDFQFGPAINPQGQRLQYILIPGSNSVAQGGTCGPAIPGTSPFHNWDAVNFEACGAGTVRVTLNSVSLVPFTGQSCGGAIGQLQGLLYQGGFESVQPANACANLLQDFMIQNSGATGALDAGDSFTFDIPSAGAYSFASMNWCDVAGSSNNGGNANFTLEFDLQCSVGAPALSSRAVAVLVVALVPLAGATIGKMGRPDNA